MRAHDFFNASHLVKSLVDGMLGEVVSDPWIVTSIKVPMINWVRLTTFWFLNSQEESERQRMNKL
jgi:hypothetical protein